MKRQYNLFVRISAIILSLALLGLYIATLVFAVIGTKSAQWWFRASIGATFFVPIILYMLMLVTKNRMQAMTATGLEGEATVDHEDSLEGEATDDHEETADTDTL